MKNVSRILPCYAADTSGVCSALYELGGMTIIHDASGCNSTYTTHDEPRWYDERSMVFISALTELDAIMGNDEQLIKDAVDAAADLRPEFIALCGSPMPMMTGVDFDAIAAEIEARSGIRTFGLHTNGTLSYISGASQAFEAVVAEYARSTPDKIPNGVNLLGATPLDFGLSGFADSARKWLAAEGFEVISSVAMGSQLSDIKKAAAASVNLVVSQSGLAAAKYMRRFLGVPFVCGVPTGERHSRLLDDALRKAAKENSAVLAPLKRDRADSEIVIIGETVQAVSLAEAVSCETGISPTVIAPLPSEEGQLSEGDRSIFAEEDIEAALAELSPQIVIADPLYRYVLPKGTRLAELPHLAFSGRSYLNRIPDPVKLDIKELIK